MWEIPFTLVFTGPFPRYFKIVWPQVCFLFLSPCTEVSQKCRVNLVAKKRVCFEGAWKFSPKKSSHRENAQTIYLYINKSLQKICCSVFKALSTMKIFSWTIHDSTQPNRKSIITKVLSFLEKKNIHHFHLIPFTSLTLRTESSDHHCELFKKNTHPR